MSIFSRLRKRDSDEPAAVSPGAGAKASAGSSPQPKASPSGHEAKPAPSQEHPNATGKAAPGGTTRVYEAAKPGAAPVARHAVPVSTAPASANSPPTSSPAALPPTSAADRAGALRVEDVKTVRGTISAKGVAAAKTTNAATGVLAAAGVQVATRASTETSRRAGERAFTAPASAIGTPRGQGEGVPDEPLSVAGSLDQALEALLPAGGEAARGAMCVEGTSTAADRKAVLATFEELAVAHTAPLRSFMLEVRWGEAQTSWIELARPALRSLRAMATQMEHPTLAAAIDGFDAVLGELLRPGTAPVVADAARQALLAAYAPLLAAMPRAFELDGERDRREPVIVRALLEQVRGLDPLMIDRLVAAGLGRLEALYRARGDEIAAVAGLPTDIAAATAERVQAFRRATPAALAAPDGAAGAHELRALVGELGADQRAFEEAARGWSEADREAKKRARRKRDVDFARVTIALARLGEVDLALHLQKVPFQRRLEELEPLVGRLAASAAPARAAEMARPTYDEIEIEGQTESGAHAAP
jgi:hypothetical protein